MTRLVRSSTGGTTLKRLVLPINEMTHETVPLPRMLSVVDRCHRLPVSAQKLLITVLVVLVMIFVITVGIGG